MEYTRTKKPIGETLIFGDAGGTFKPIAINTQVNGLNSVIYASDGTNLVVVKADSNGNLIVLPAIDSANNPRQPRVDDLSGDLIVRIGKNLAGGFEYARFTNTGALKVGVNDNGDPVAIKTVGTNNEAGSIVQSSDVSFVFSYTSFSFPSGNVYLSSYINLSHSKYLSGYIVSDVRLKFTVLQRSLNDVADRLSDDIYVDMPNVNNPVYFKILKDMDYVRFRIENIDTVNATQVRVFVNATN